MVRRWILHSLAWPLIVLTLVPTSKAVAGEVIDAKIYSSRGGAYLYFRGFDPERIYQAHKEVYLDLRYDNEFAVESLKLSVNGLAYSGTEKKWKRAGEWKSDGSRSQLRMRIGPLKFGGKKRFFRILEEVYHYNGWLRIYVHSPQRLRAARLVFGQGKPQPPRAFLDRVEPRYPLLRTRDVKFHFHGDDHAVGFECALKGKLSSWRACESPVAYRDLKNRRYKFKVRAIGANGSRGKAVKYAFQVRAPLPGVKIQQVTPAEAVTSERDITIRYKKLGKHAKWARTYCRIDRGRFYWCQSPLKYENLSLGDHAIEIRRTHWIYGYRWGRWLGKFDWFRRHVPVHTAPVVHRWTISDSKPQVAWVDTPDENTAEDSASFQFEGTGVDRFTCALDNGAAEDCSGEVLLEGLAEGAHQFTVVGYSGGQTSEPLTYHWKVDQTAPALSWGSVNPEGEVVGVQELAVSMVSDEPADYSCALDGTDLGACDSQFVLTDLGEGAHRLEVVGQDAVGNRSAPLVYEWSVDLTAPDLTVQMTFPETTPTSSPRADFSVVVAGEAALRCGLDGAELAPCDSTVSFENLSEGPHDLVVVAEDSAGNTAESGFSWVVDATAPAFSLGTANPSEPVTLSSSLELPFAVSEAASVTCELDLGGQIPCSSPFVANGLAEGPHKVELIAVDAAGNSSSVAYEWVVKVEAVVQLTGAEPAVSPTAMTTAGFSFASTNASGFECQLDDAPAASCVSGQAYSGLEDGDHRFQVWGLNHLGERGPVQVHEWNVDTVGAEVVLGAIDPPGDATSSDIRIEFSSEPEAAFFCRLDGADEVECASPFLATGLSKGSHSFEVVAEDALGNRGAPQSHSWVVDVPAPAVQILSQSPAEALTSLTDMALTFSAVDAASYECRLDSAAFEACASPVNYTDLADGQHVFEVRALNGFGDVGAVASHTWVVDTTGPDVVLGSIQPPGDSDQTQIEIAFSAEPDSVFNCQLDGGPEEVCVSPFVRSDLGQGVHTIQIVAEDSLGNRGAAASHSWTVDVLPPNAVVDSVTPAATPTQSTEIQFVFSGADAYECRLDGAGFTPCASPMFYTGLSDGDHEFEMRGLNAFGEAGPVSAYYWTVDNTGPVTLFVNVDPAGDTDQTSVTAHFTSEAGAKFFCQLDGGAEQSCVSPFSASNLGQGSHALRVVAEDGLGNRGIAIVHQWTVDVPPPTIQFDSVSPSGSQVNVATMAIGFSGSGAASFECRLDGAAFAPCTSPVNYSGLSEGAHLFEVRALNAFGEASPIGGHSWNVDTVAPVVQIDGALPAVSPTTETYLELSFSSAESGVTFRCSLDGAAFAACTSPLGVNVDVGAHSVVVEATDSAGNVGQTQYQWEVEAPALELSGEAVKDVQSDSAIVEWQTNLPANTRVIYGEGSALDLSTALDPALTTSHSQTLTGLKAFTVYSAQAISIDDLGREVRSPVLVFRTQF